MKEYSLKIKKPLVTKSESNINLRAQIKLAPLTGVSEKSSIMKSSELDDLLKKHQQKRTSVEQIKRTLNL
ncbi:hypothetical protein ROZALSC1DRAFT_30785 [Rozella allomycis CSF55]|uniref:Uncharacterized protein n=1 Tax=Rozella allomycis (strain CSF55) TaxID=988480 RepID=A0A075B1M0_ROZAC|nr:hypothetical protein O9G_006201 [Rozella allomycis CSF55]RKP17400.1 hypothetical protein ROZALSC1DRAFT_30785 [Rozella allomycis CSF55]|eukprot:EPZ36482.1 hypothetical protein O9G_006201 [Rozella allomycis CSF55]